MERNQPRFPERGGGTELRGDGGGRLSTDVEGRGRTSQRVDEEQSERQPLLPAAAAGDYASVGLQQPSSDTWQRSPPNTAAYTPPPPYS